MTDQLCAKLKAGTLDHPPRVLFALHCFGCQVGRGMRDTWNENSFFVNPAESPGHPAKAKLPTTLHTGASNRLMDRTSVAPCLSHRVSGKGYAFMKY